MRHLPINRTVVGRIPIFAHRIAAIIVRELSVVIHGSKRRELLDATRDAIADAKASKRGLDAARFLVVHGAQDHVVPLSCVHEFVSAARLPPGALRVVKKGGHDLTGGQGGDEACAAALDWLDSER